MALQVLLKHCDLFNGMMYMRFRVRRFEAVRGLGFHSISVSCKTLYFWAIEVCGGFPKLGVPFWGIPSIRIIVYWSLYGGPLILGNYHMSRPMGDSDSDPSGDPAQRPSTLL